MVMNSVLYLIDSLFFGFKIFFRELMIYSYINLYITYINKIRVISLGTDSSALDLVLHLYQSFSRRKCFFIV